MGVKSSPSSMAGAGPWRLERAKRIWDAMEWALGTERRVRVVESGKEAEMFIIKSELGHAPR